ncbi:MAG: pyridoxal 5'-phosphate synthase glutaminase subunit PdxT [Thermoplasmata archaeon]
MRVGVLGVQGAVTEHVFAFNNAFSDAGIAGDVITVRKKYQLDNIDALVLPGGESSTISRLLDILDLRSKVISEVKNGMPIMGTCAGTVLLASCGDESVEHSDTHLLELLDVSVIRNAFGRQRESFECFLDIDGLNEPFPGVFIRAPVMNLLPNSRAKVIARYDGKIVGVEQEHILSFSFHPELTDDTRMHRYFLEKIF